MNGFVKFDFPPLDIRHNSRTRMVSLPIISMERARAPFDYAVDALARVLYGRSNAERRKRTLRG
jgi:hypothetical protein